MDEAETKVLAYMSFPANHWPQIHSANSLERPNGRGQTSPRVVGIFPNDPAITRLVRAILLEQNGVSFESVGNSCWIGIVIQSRPKVNCDAEALFSRACPWRGGAGRGLAPAISSIGRISQITMAGNPTTDHRLRRPWFPALHRARRKARSPSGAFASRRRTMKFDSEPECRCWFRKAAGSASYPRVSSKAQCMRQEIWMAEAWKDGCRDRRVCRDLAVKYAKASACIRWKRCSPSTCFWPNIRNICAHPQGGGCGRRSFAFR
jgi:hypothetical protein